MRHRCELVSLSGGFSSLSPEKSTNNQPFRTLARKLFSVAVFPFIFEKKSIIHPEAGCKSKERGVRGKGRPHASPLTSTFRHNFQPHENKMAARNPPVTRRPLADFLQQVRTQSLPELPRVQRHVVQLTPGRRGRRSTWAYGCVGKSRSPPTSSRSFPTLTPSLIPSNW